MPEQDLTRHLLAKAARGRPDTRPRQPQPPFRHRPTGRSRNRRPVSDKGPLALRERGTCVRDGRTATGTLALSGGRGVPVECSAETKQGSQCRPRAREVRRRSKGLRRPCEPGSALPLRPRLRSGVRPGLIREGQRARRTRGGDELGVRPRRRPLASAPPRGAPFAPRVHRRFSGRVSCHGDVWASFSFPRPAESPAHSGRVTQ